MVEKHIKSLLYDHDCVIIPEFGGLITRYVSARINPVKHTLAPPSKKIAFNEKLVLNDGLLISTIAYQSNVSKEEAQRMVSAFVHQARTKLHAENRYELEDIGVFRYNAERRLVFDYVESDNLLEASFGLPELVARPIRVEEPAVLRTLIKERQQPEEVNQKLPFRKRLKRAYNIAAGLAMGGLTVSALYFLSLQTDYNLSSLNPLSFSNGQFMSVNPASAADRYASDFVPLTEEERLATYEPIMPAFAPVAVADEYAVEGAAGHAFEGEGIALAGEAEGFTSEEVTEESAPVEEVVETKEPVLTINGKTGRFYIITGGYSRLESAEASREAIRKQGQEAKVLLPLAGSKLYRVSAADFDTKEEALAQLNSYRKLFGETTWVLNN